jgi:ABC-type polysaccharide/polyol phosphate transport system ATPase subunit
MDLLAPLAFARRAPVTAPAPAVELTDVTLAYRLSRSHSSSLKEFAIELTKRRVRYEQKLALRDVSMTVRPGEVVAVIGANGAGKSTMMKLIARVLPPTAGRVVVRGRIAPMIELGAGFNIELTGYENAVLYGTLLGRDPAYVRARLGHIAEWAGLVDRMDVPVRSYSSGMLARVGFSVAVDIEPDVLVVDEVLAVGDEAFQQRSGERMNQLIEAGAAVVLVSHQLDQVLARAQRVVWLDAGRVQLSGEPSEVVAAYRSSLLP